MRFAHSNSTSSRLMGEGWVFYRSCRRGFTLIEMVVVVVLIGIMAAMIVPEMKGSFDDALLRSTGRDLINVFNLASSRAVSMNRACRVKLDTQAGHYLVERQVNDGYHETYVPLKDVAGAQGNLDSRVTIEISPTEATPPDNSADDSSASSMDAVAFYPDGTADAVQIRLRDHAGYQILMRLNPVTARVRFTDPEHE